MKKWSEQEDSWLLANACRYSTYDACANALNAACGGERSAMAIKCRLNQRHKRGLECWERMPYTDAERRYIVENYRHKSMRELADGLRTLTGRSVTPSAIGHYMSDTLGIKRYGRTGPIKKGEKLGYVAPIGAERINNDGYTLVKVTNTGAKNRDWKTKQAVEWERLHGAAPRGVVVFLDGDRTNFAPENLYCVNRKIHAVMNINRWYTTSKEHTLTAIKWCELLYAIKEVEKG